MTELPLFPFVLSEADEDDPVGIALRSDAPVMRARTELGDEAWVAMTYETARQVVTDPRFSRAAAFQKGAPRTTSAQATGEMIINMEREAHSRTRRLMAQALTVRSQERMRPGVRKLVDELLDQLSSPADLLSQLATPLPVTVICQLFGAPEPEWERLRQWADEIQRTTSFTAVEIMDEVTEVAGFGYELIELKRRQPGEDLTTDLLRVSDEQGGLTDAQIVDNLMLILVAANDATLKELAVCLVALLRRPERYRWLSENPETVPSAVEELIRFARLSRSGLPPRIAVEDVELGGQLIRTGEGVIPLHHLAHRDPEVFSEPNTMDLQRPDAAKHLGFGGGMHYCIGAPLARVMMQESLDGLVRRFPSLRLAVPWEGLEWQQNGLLRCPMTIPVEW